MTKRALLLSLGLFAVSLFPGAARPAAASQDVLIGVDRIQGDFLGDDGQALDEFWLQGEFGSAATRLVVRVPYVRVDHTGLVTFAQDAPIILGAGGPGRPAWQTSTAGDSESGLGDVLLRSETYLARSGRGKSPGLILDVDYKWGTASADNGLGTGEGDWRAGLDYVQPISKMFQILGAVSYNWLGSPEGVRFDHRLRLEAGFAIVTRRTTWRIVGENVTPALSEVPVYDGTGTPTGTIDVQDYRIARGEFVYRSAAGGSTRLFVLGGFNDSSPRIGFGLSFASRPQ